MEAKIKKVKNNAIYPTVATEKSAGYDLYACIENEEKSIIIFPGSSEKIGTGISITPPPGYFAAIFPRSGLSTKQGLRLANCVGVCDEDYTGEYIVSLYNDSNNVKKVSNGDRIAQIVFLPYAHVDFDIVDELDTTSRGSGGFGSTGK